MDLIQFFPNHSLPAYVTFSGVLLSNKVRFINTGQPEWEIACGMKLPILMDGKKVICGEEEIIKYFKQNYSNLDAGLSRDSLSQIAAYSSLITNDLANCCLVAQYDDEENYLMNTAKQLKKSIPWPFHRFYAWNMKRTALNTIAHLNWGNYAFDRLGKAKQIAFRVYRAFEGKLALTPELFILGTRSPCSLDALLYGHLCDAQSQPLLFELLTQEFPALLAYKERIASHVNQAQLNFANTSKFDTIKYSNNNNDHKTVQYFIPPASYSRVTNTGENGEKKTIQPTTMEADGGGTHNKKTKEQIEFEQGSKRALIVGALCVVTYILYSVRVSVVFEDNSSSVDSSP